MATEQILVYVNGLIVAVLWSACALTFAWRWGFLVWRKQAFTPEIKGVDVIRGFSAFLIAQLIIVPSLALLFLSWHRGILFDHRTVTLDAYTQGWLALLTIAGGAIGVALMARSINKSRRAEIWGSGALSNLAFGMASWFLSYPVVMVFGQIIALFTMTFFGHSPTDQAAVEHLKTIKGNPYLLAATCMMLITVVPIVEEWLFRGLLQSWLSTKLSRYGAILLASLTFAIFHFSIKQGTTNIELLSSLFVLSLFLGYLFERQRSLWAPIGLHAFFNGVSVLILLLE